MNVGARRDQAATGALAERCVAADRDHPHPATDGYLCRNHMDQLGAALRAIDDEMRQLDPAPSFSADYSGAGASLASQRSPARLAAIVLADRRHGTGWAEEGDDARVGRLMSAYAVLHRYAQRIREERSMTHPGRVYVARRRGAPLRGPACARPCRHDTCQAMVRWQTVPAVTTTSGERDFLTRQLDWAVRQRWAAHMWADVQQLLEQLLAANQALPPRPVTGRCPISDEATGRVCGGRLAPIRPQYTAGEWTGSAPSSIRCESCAAKWEGPSNLARLALMLGSARGSLVDARSA